MNLIPIPNPFQRIAVVDSRRNTLFDTRRHRQKIVYKAAEKWYILR